MSEYEFDRIRELEAQLQQRTRDLDEVKNALNEEKAKNSSLQSSLRLHADPDKVTLSADYAHDLNVALGCDDEDDVVDYAERLKERAEAAEHRYTSLLVKIQGLRRHVLSFDPDDPLGPSRYTNVVKWADLQQAITEDEL